MLARLALPLLLAASPAAACPPAGVERGSVALDGRGDLVLPSGRRAVLAGLRLPEPGPVRDAALAWLGRAASGPVEATALGPEDRWARLPVRAVAEPRLDLAHGLLERGLAVADPRDGCHPEFPAIEAAAREGGLGVWGRPGYKPRRADDGEALREAVGRFTLVEGRVRSVAERRGRTYLNLGPDGRSHASVIVPQRTWRTMVARGLAAQALRGRRVRARGVLDWGRGPSIELAAPEALELLDDGRGQR